jgi:hypothetical protein
MSGHEDKESAVSFRKVVRLVSTPLTLAILLGGLVYGAYWGFQQVTAEVEVAPPVACVTQPMTELTAAEVTVNVYNAGNQSGLASRIAETLGAAGFRIGHVDNSDESVLALRIIGAASTNPEVRLVASWFVDPEIQADQRVDHTVDIILGLNFDEETGLGAEPLTSLPIPTGQVCLPSISPSPSPTGTAPPTDQPT